MFRSAAAAVVVFFAYMLIAYRCERKNVEIRLHTDTLSSRFARIAATTVLIINAFRTQRKRHQSLSNIYIYRLLLFK